MEAGSGGLGAGAEVVEEPCGPAEAARAARPLPAAAAAASQRPRSPIVRPGGPAAA